MLYTTRNLGSRLDPLIELLAPDGLLLARDDDSGGGLNAFVQGVLPQDGTYTVTIRTAREDCGGEYTLMLERDWGGQSGVRGALALDGSVSSSLSVDADVRREVWSFPATAGERITLTMDTSGPSRLQIANPNGDWE